MSFWLGPLGLWPLVSGSCGNKLEEGVGLGRLCQAASTKTGGSSGLGVLSCCYPQKRSTVWIGDHAVVPYILCVSAPLDHEVPCGPSLMSTFLANKSLLVPLGRKNLTEWGGQGVLFGQPLPVSIQRCRKHSPLGEGSGVLVRAGLLAPDQLLMSPSSVRARLLMSIFGPLGG